LQRDNRAAPAARPAWLESVRDFNAFRCDPGRNYFFAFYSCVPSANALNGEMGLRELRPGAGNGPGFLLGVIRS